MAAAKRGPKGARRATQKERREATVRKLLDATTEALIDVGYAGASVQEICRRAELSQGALFRHFPTREALLGAVGEDVGRKTLAHYRRQFESHAARDSGRNSGEPLARALRLLRAQCRSRLNQAWYELAMAARTRKELRKALEPVGARFYADIEALARQLLPDLAARLGSRFGVLLDTVIAVFDGEEVRGFVVKRARVDEARLALLETMLLGLLAPTTSGQRATRTIGSKVRNTKSHSGELTP
jgi:AcrR family transcriptional regulator